MTVIATDHCAYRVKRENHEAVCKMFIDLFGYEKSDSFEPEFPDGTSQSTVCTVLSPKGVKNDTIRVIEHDGHTYQLPPDIFISSSSDPNSIVAKFVENRGSVGSLVHHFAFSTDSVVDTMKEFHKAGFNFLSEEPIICDELTQNFTETSIYTNTIYEFIERRAASFCRESVGKLMQITEAQK